MYFTIVQVHATLGENVLHFPSIKVQQYWYSTCMRFCSFWYSCLHAHSYWEWEHQNVSVKTSSQPSGWLMTVVDSQVITCGINLSPHSCWYRSSSSIVLYIGGPRLCRKTHPCFLQWKQLHYDPGLQCGYSSYCRTTTLLLIFPRS